MNKEKILDVVTHVMFIVGFIVMMGAVGYSDYCEAAHQPSSLTELIVNCAIGAALMWAAWNVREIEL